MTEQVLEIGGFAAGYAGRLFVRAGADVLRVESPSAPAYASHAAMEAYLHAGKQRIAAPSVADLKVLADRADVVVCEAGTADEVEMLGLDRWQTPAKVSITPFGRTGSKRNWRAAPNVLLAMGGYTYIVGDADKAPLTVPGHYVEFQSGALAHLAANACRLADEPNTADISQLETVMSLSQFTTVRWHCAGEIRQRHGSDFWFVVPSELFRCTDGWVYINIIPTFWDAFTVFIGHPEWLLDDRFADNDLRMVNRDELHEMVAAELCDLSTADVDERARACRIPLGVVQSFGQVLDDEHLRERDFWDSVRMIDGQTVQVPRSTVAPASDLSVQAPSHSVAELSW